MNKNFKKQTLHRLMLAGTSTGILGLLVFAYVLYYDVPQYDENPNTLRSRIDYMENLYSFEYSYAWERSVDTLRHDAEYKQLQAQLDTAIYPEYHNLIERLDSINQDRRIAYMKNHSKQLDEYNNNLKQAYKRLDELEKMEQKRDSILSQPITTRLKRNARKIRADYAKTFQTITQRSK